MQCQTKCQQVILWISTNRFYSLYREAKGRIVKSMLKEKNKIRLTLPDFKTYYKMAIIKRVWYW